MAACRPRHAVRGPLPLEDRATPAVFTATVDPAVDNPGAVAELVRFFDQANRNGDPADTVNLFPGGKYTFTRAVDRFDGGTALPVVDNRDGSATFTLNGNGATFFRPDDAESLRFLRAEGAFLTQKVVTLVVNDLTLDGGNVFDAALPSRDDAKATPIRDGGAIRTRVAILRADNVRFLNNQAAGRAGAISFGNLFDQPTAHVLRDCLFDGNESKSVGGAASVDLSDTVDFVDCVFTRNKAGEGAAVLQAFTEAVRFDRCRLVGNLGRDIGAVAVLGDVELRQTLVQGNVADPGGVAGVQASNIFAFGSTIADNKALGGLTAGGLIANRVELTNTTVHNNNGSIGAGIQADTAVLVSSTLTNNTATFGLGVGGGIEARVVILTNSVVAGNRSLNNGTFFASPVDDISAAERVVSGGGNVIGVAPDKYVPGPGDVTGTADAPVRALLAPLRDNGGPVPTRRPYRGSPAVGAGQPGVGAPTDARGLPRAGAVTAGAYGVQPDEVLFAPPVPPPGVTAVAPGEDPFIAAREAAARPVAQTSRSLARLRGIPPVRAEAQLLEADGKVRFAVTPFGGVLGGVRVATADLTGDGVPDLVAGTGPGVPATVRVFDGTDGRLVFDVTPFEASFAGGVFVAAAGDLTGDGVADLVVTPDDGGGPRVRVFRAGDFAPVADFFGIDDPAFRGGARAAVADVTGDGVADLAVAAGRFGGPRVAVWDGTSLANGAFGRKPFGDFFVFEDGVRDGAYLAAGDVDGDGFADLVAGGGPGGGPRVRVVSGQGLVNGFQTELANFFAGDVNTRGGARVAVKDLDGDESADVVVGAGSGAGSRVTGYPGALLLPGADPTPVLGADPFPEFPNGVFVG